MALHLITGFAGVEHVTADNAGHLNAQILGAQNFIFAFGEQFRSNLNSNNEVRIYDGMGIVNGRQFELPAGTYQDMTIENGEQSMFRNDLIVARYSLNANTGIETIALTVIKGTPNESQGVDPEYNTGNILEGATDVDFPLYRIKLDGLNVTDVEALFEVKGNIADIIGNTDISEIGDGTLTGATSSLNQQIAGINTCVHLAHLSYGTSAVDVNTLDDLEKYDNFDLILYYGNEPYASVKIPNSSTLLEHGARCIFFDGNTKAHAIINAGGSKTKIKGYVTHASCSANLWGHKKI